MISFWKEVLQLVLLVDFYCSQEHLEFNPQFSLPPSEFLKLETLAEVLHLLLKALVFDTQQEDHISADYLL